MNPAVSLTRARSRRSAWTVSQNVRRTASSCASTGWSWAWLPAMKAGSMHKPAPDTAAFNHWVTAALADHTRSALLKHDWRKLAVAELHLSEAQREHLA